MYAWRVYVYNFNMEGLQKKEIDQPLIKQA